MFASPILMRAERSSLIVVDIQAKLAPVVTGQAQIVDRAEILLRAAERLAIPVLMSEQYPQGLGPTLPALAALAPASTRVEKVAFSCADEPAFMERFQALERDQAVILGMEAHVCVLQTAMSLKAVGIETFVVADATGSRDPANAEAALARMARAGVEIVTTEMVLFEWLRQAGSDEFKELSKLIK